MKSQKLPYRNWDRLRVIETKEQLADFFKQDPFFRDFLLKRTSPGKVHQIFEEGKIADTSEFDYLCEATKSALFRAGGSSIMDWGCWYKGNHALEIERISERETERIEVYGASVELPVRFKIALPEKLYEGIRTSANLIHEAIRKHISGAKTLSRIDYIVKDEGKAYIVDIGESNTTLGLTDALYRFAGLGNGTLLEEYFERVVEEQRALVPDIQRLVFVAEDEKMLQDISYEFQTFQSFIQDHYSIPTAVVLKSGLHTLPQDGFVRCFRRPISESPRMVDDTSAIPVYRKDFLFEILEALKKDFPPTIFLPYHHLSVLEDPEGTANKIHRHALEHGLKDFVVKPSVKSSKSSSLAFLYSADNPAHLRQLRKTVRKLSKEEHIPHIILEENIESEVADGRKLEVRVHCLSN